MCLLKFLRHVILNDLYNMYIVYVCIDDHPQMPQNDAYYNAYVYQDGTRSYLYIVCIYILYLISTFIYLPQPYPLDPRYSVSSVCIFIEAYKWYGRIKYPNRAP